MVSPQSHRHPGWLSQGRFPNLQDGMVLFCYEEHRVAGVRHPSLVNRASRCVLSRLLKSRRSLLLCRCSFFSGFLRPCLSLHSSGPGVCPNLSSLEPSGMSGRASWPELLSCGPRALCSLPDWHLYLPTVAPPRLLADCAGHYCLLGIWESETGQIHSIFIGGDSEKGLRMGKERGK